MIVNCLENQKESFEIRFLKRLAEPVFISSEDIEARQNAPLVLFGKWYDGDMSSGVSWLTERAYHLKYPCIILPPFQLGNMRTELKLDVNMEVMNLETNDLKSVDEELTTLANKDTFSIQTDFAFFGPAGKALVVDKNKKDTVIIAIQPKNTATPMVLCSANLLGASSLSNTEDRYKLFNALVIWSSQQENIPQTDAPVDLKIAQQIPIEIVNCIAVLLSTTKPINHQELSKLAMKTFGIKLSNDVVKGTLGRLAQKGLVEIFDNEDYSIRRELLEQYLQNVGLWSHVRILRKDLKKAKP